jgi:uncharacterized membrane protein YeaQ/YmgE (transglycosylase-associated protein family)
MAVLDSTSIIILLLVGLVAGFLAGKIVRGAGFGVIGDIVIGIIGAFVGYWLLGMFGLILVGILGMIISATIGAVVLVVIVRLIRRI